FQLFSSLFPYTTLFRSRQIIGDRCDNPAPGCTGDHQYIMRHSTLICLKFIDMLWRVAGCIPTGRHRPEAAEKPAVPHPRLKRDRSEEHTSELQSRSDLV